MSADEVITHSAALHATFGGLSFEKNFGELVCLDDPLILDKATSKHHNVVHPAGRNKT
jgi:hypothetical protein